MDLLRNKKEAVKKIENLNSNNIATTRINIYEILLGAFLRGQKDQQKFSEKAKLILDRIEILDFNETACINSARINANLILNGREIESTDSMIAGTMIANGCDTIITQNKDHFERIKEIKVEGY
ncbi:MAG: type II toxin-antitoxin system VapC family toxin [Nanoarchaeota archaeon]|nr:type II toxin-antitoxin system VapC family toxin [Nanoarchaeota archaeon]MBU1946878.1 type II toxin-antitoxin system VapC family toxin [Nanoarchaeota archaeon]